MIRVLFKADDGGMVDVTIPTVPQPGHVVKTKDGAYHVTSVTWHMDGDPGEPVTASVAMSRTPPATVITDGEES